MRLDSAIIAIQEDSEAELIEIAVVLTFDGFPESKETRSQNAIALRCPRYSI
jgi:hypothetical protein